MDDHAWVGLVGALVGLAAVAAGLTLEFPTGTKNRRWALIGTGTIVTAVGLAVGGQL